MQWSKTFQSNNLRFLAEHEFELLFGMQMLYMQRIFAQKLGHLRLMTISQTAPVKTLIEVRQLVTEGNTLLFHQDESRFARNAGRSLNQAKT